MGGHVVAKRKEDKLEGVSVADYRFVEEIPDVPWPRIYREKGKTIEGLCVRIVEL